MKITQVISDTNIGGAGILLSSVTEGLANDYDFEIIIPRGSRLRQRLPVGRVGIVELDFKGDKSFSLNDSLMFYRYFRSNPTDLVHTHASLSARLGAAASGVPRCICTRHCAYPDSQIKKRSSLALYLYDFATDLTLSTADCARANLIAEGVNPKKIVTVKNGSKSRERLSLGRQNELRDSLGIPRGARIIGSVARLERVKGQDLILRAAASICKDFGDVAFLFVGDGSLSDYYKKLAARLGISDKVFFTGYVDKPWEYESLFYVNVNASRGTETSCLATSECMAMGIPCIVSDFGGNTEMIENRVCGLVFKTDDLFSLTDALAEILSDGELYRSLSSGASRAYRERFTIQRMLDDYRRLYSTLPPRRNRLLRTK